MPIYEYKCNECDNIFEVLTLSAKDNGQISCPKCNSDKTDKLLSSGSFRLTTGRGSAAAPPAGCSSSGGFS